MNPVKQDILQWPEYKTLKRITELASRGATLTQCADIVHEIAQREGQSREVIAALGEVLVRIATLHREGQEELRRMNTKAAA
jgi:hypothetical protein